MYSDVIEIDKIPPKQNVEYYRKVQKTTSRTVYEDGKKPQHKEETKTYVERSNNPNQKSGQFVPTSNYRNNISGSKYNNSLNQKNQTNSKNYSSNSQSYTFNSKQYDTSNKISNSKNNTYLPTRTNNFSNRSQRSNNESRSYNKEKLSFAGTLKGRSNNTNSNVEYRNRDGSQIYKSEPKPMVIHERIIIRIQNKRRPRKGEPVENFEYHESKEIKKNNRNSFVSHRRWGDPFYQLIDRNKKYSSLTVGSRGYRYTNEFGLDDYSKERNRTIDTDDRNQSRFRNTREDKNKYQNKTNSSRGTLSSQNYNNYKSQKQDTLNSINYNTLTQGSQSTNYGNYKTLTQNTRGTQGNTNYRNNKYNESYKRIQMTEQVDERRKYNPNRGYQGRFSEVAQKTDISKRNDNSYMNRRGKSNTSTSINRNQYDSNRGKSNDSVNRRNQYTIESKRVETKYNISNIGNQKRNSEPYKREAGISIDTDKYKRRNAPTENRRKYEKTTEVRETRQKYTSEKYAPNQNNKYGRGTDTQVRTYESKYVRESYNKGTDNQEEGDGSDKYGRGSGSQVKTDESKYVSESIKKGTDNEEEEGNKIDGRERDSKEGEDGTDEFGRPKEMDSNMQNQQTEELYQKEKMMYSQQDNDDEQQNRDSNFCPIHGYHNIYDEEIQNNNQFEEDQKEINRYEREEGMEQRYGVRQGGLSKEQEEFERRQREYLQRQEQIQQNQLLDQRFANNMGRYEDGRQRNEYMQQQINNTQGSMNVQGQDNTADNYRFYESKYVTSSSDNTNIFNQRNYMSNMNNQRNINTIKLNKVIGRGSGMSYGEGIDLSKIYIATKVTPVYSEIIDQQFQNLGYSQTQVCNICGNPYDDVQLIDEQQQEQGQGFVYNPYPYPIQGEMMEQQIYGDY